MNIDVLEMLLQKEGVRCTTVDSARAVSSTVEHIAPVDIVFLDLEFPNGDGFHLFNEFKVNPKLNTVPIVAYTVHISEIDKARRHGFHSFIGKPLSIQRFPLQVQKILAGTPVWEI